MLPYCSCKQLTPWKTHPKGAREPDRASVSPQRAEGAEREMTFPHSRVCASHLALPTCHPPESPLSPMGLSWSYFKGC